MMKELKVLAKGLEKIGYKDLAASILKMAEEQATSKPQKIKISVKASGDNKAYTMTVTPILLNGTTGQAETINYSTSKDLVKLLPDKAPADIINKFFGPNTILSSSMVVLELPPGKTNQDFGIVIK